MIVLHTVFYLLIFVACMAHLNRIHGIGAARLTSFALTAAGAAGCALAIWFDGVGNAPWWELMFLAGVAGISVFHFGVDRRRKHCPWPLPTECVEHQAERRFTRPV